MKTAATIVNPTRPGALRPVEWITDRAKRYRAVAAIAQKEKRCIYCGIKPARPMVDHIDGREANGNPANLAYACRSCNTKKGAHYVRQGAGKRTRQYNPGKKTGAGIRSLAQFIQAIQAVKGEGAQMDLFAAQELLHNTSPNERSRWAKEANARRWASGRRSEVPF